MNIQQTRHNRQLITYNYEMQSFDAGRFAEWLETAFQESRFKSYAQLANESGVTRSTVSALAKARPQTSTGKPSRPERETVTQLANALGKDVNEGLLLSGHSPDLEHELSADGIFTLYNKLDEDDRILARRQIRAILISFDPTKYEEGANKKRETWVPMDQQGVPSNPISLDEATPDRREKVADSDDQAMDLDEISPKELKT